MKTADSYIRCSDFRGYSLLFPVFENLHQVPMIGDSSIARGRRRKYLGRLFDFGEEPDYKLAFIWASLIYDGGRPSYIDCLEFLFSRFSELLCRLHVGAYRVDSHFQRMIIEIELPSDYFECQYSPSMYFVIKYVLLLYPCRTETEKCFSETHRSRYNNDVFLTCGNDVHSEMW